MIDALVPASTGAAYAFDGTTFCVTETDASTASAEQRWQLCDVARYATGLVLSKHPRNIWPALPTGRAVLASVPGVGTQEQRGSFYALDGVGS